MEKVNDLSDLYQEIIPLLLIIGIEPTFLSLLCDGEVGLTLRVSSPVEILEIGVAKIFSLLLPFHTELLHTEDILLVDGIAFAQRLD